MPSASAQDHLPQLTQGKAGRSQSLVLRHLLEGNQQGAGEDRGLGEGEQGAVLGAEPLCAQLPQPFRSLVLRQTYNRRGSLCAL